MDARAAHRARAVPELATLLRSRDFRSALGRHLDPHHQSVIVVLPDDPMGYVFDRLRDADNAAAVVMADGYSYQIAMCWPASRARKQVAREDDAVAKIHPGSNVAMLFAYLREVETAVICQVAAQLVDHGELVPT